MQKTPGPVILDLIGQDITQEESELLLHPLVGGVILFARHYESPVQIRELTRMIRDRAKKKPVLITVDQEGGRVQRFRNGFVLLPSMKQIGQLYQDSPRDGLAFAYCCGWLMAAELLSVGIDLSFAPVLDLDRQFNTVIGDRSFSMLPTEVATLAQSVMYGMREAGMAATGKHFPGHGGVNVDSHISMPIDQRRFTEIESEDLQPFKQLVSAGIDSMMSAHILFPEIDPLPVSFSRYWLHDVLRQQLNFSGVIFSDDLNMEGAQSAGTYANRATTALNAGCDMILICNNRAGAIDILDNVPHGYQLSNEKFQRLQGKFSTQSQQTLHTSEIWKNNFSQFIQYRNIYADNR